jgi:hypothetical protein
MSKDLLSRIRTEIDERLAELRPAVEEVSRLEAALSALDAGGVRPRATPRARRSRGPSAVAARAPRGANRHALLAAANKRPGASAAELAKVAAIKLTTARTTLSSLVRAGELRRDEVGGVTGYHRAPG